MIIKKISDMIFIMFLCTFYSYAFAYEIDVSTFDIKGIKLNKTYDSLEKVLPCPADITDSKTDSGKVYLYFLECKKKSDGTYSVILNREKKIMSLMRILESDIPFDVEKIKVKIFKKYGKPKMTTFAKSSNNSNYVRGFCWGDCKSTRKKHKGLHGNFVDDKRVEKKALVIKFIERDGEFEMLFMYTDVAMYKKIRLWEDNENMLFKNTKIKKKTDVDL